MPIRYKILFVSALALTALPLQAQNLVVNPGFETGDFTGWTESGSNSDFVTSLGAHSGTYAAFFAPSAGFGDDTLSQVVPTSTGNYQVSFWIRGLSNAFSATDFVTASWGGSNLPFSVPADETYHKYSFIVPGNVGGTELFFTFGQDRQGGALLDDVSVQAVPEPASLAALGFGALALARRRRK